MTYDNLQPTDTMIVNRDGNSYSIPVDSFNADDGTLRDTDLFLVNRGENSYKITKAILSEEIGSTPSPENPFIQKPSIVSPEDGSISDFLRPTFTSSQAEGAYIDRHYSSTWEIATDTDFNNIVDGTVDSTRALTSYTTSINLTPSTTYYVRVKYRPNTATAPESEYSDPISITLSDNPTSGGIGATSFFSIDAALPSHPLDDYGTALTSNMPIASLYSTNGGANTFYNQYGKKQNRNASNYVNWTANNAQEIDWPEAGPIISQPRCFQLWGQGWADQGCFRADGKFYQATGTYDYERPDGAPNVLKVDGNPVNTLGVETSPQTPHVTDPNAGIGNYGCPLLALWSENTGLFYMFAKGTRSGFCSGNPINNYYSFYWFGNNWNSLAYINCSSGIQNASNYPFYLPPASHQPGRLPGDVPIRTFGITNYRDLNNSYQITCILAIGEDNKLYQAGSNNSAVTMPWNRTGPDEWAADPSDEEFAWIYTSRGSRDNASSDSLVSAVTLDGRLFVGWRTQACLVGSAANRSFAEWLPEQFPKGDHPPDYRFKTPLLKFPNKNEAWAVGIDNKIYHFYGSARDENNELGRMGKAVQIGTQADVYSTGVPSWYYKLGMQAINYASRDVFTGTSYINENDPPAPASSQYYATNVASIVTGSIDKSATIHNFQVVPEENIGGVKGFECVYINSNKTTNLELKVNETVVFGFTGFVPGTFAVHANEARSITASRFNMLDNVGVFKPDVPGTYYWSGLSTAHLSSDDPDLQEDRPVSGTITVIDPNNTNPVTPPTTDLIPDDWTNDQRRAAMEELIREYRATYGEEESY